LLRIGLVEALTAGLRGAEARQRAIAHNLANLNTPGYKRWDVQFDEADQLALSDTADPEAAEATGPQWVRDTSTSGRPDGNNVDLEAELALMADNGLYQRALATLLTAKLTRLRTAISRGGE